MTTLEQRTHYFVGHFNAMASHCEVLIDTYNKNLAQQITDVVAHEVTRIEHKYSRYRDSSLLQRINRGGTVQVDSETAQLLDYANQLFQLSEGRFDITSGVLRRAWHFDGSSNIPSKNDVKALLPFIGWDKVMWNTHAPQIKLAKGMEIDFGGIGKEYAADRAAYSILALLTSQSSIVTDNTAQNTSVLINLGGDLSVTGPRTNGEGWQVGIGATLPPQKGAQTGPPPVGTLHPSSPPSFTVTHGGIATSGDAHRFLEKDGVRYSHVIDPRTGWPVVGAPASVTVHADTCTDAGMLSTLALLHGPDAEDFLQAQDVPFWCLK